MVLDIKLTLCRSYTVVVSSFPCELGGLQEVVNSTCLAKYRPRLELAYNRRGTLYLFNRHKRTSCEMYLWMSVEGNY